MDNQLRPHTRMGEPIVMVDTADQLEKFRRLNK